MLYNIIHSILLEAEDINGYGLFSFLLFFGFFLGVLVWVCRLKKNYLSQMGGLPLEAGEKKTPDKIQSEKI